MPNDVCKALSSIFHTVTKTFEKHKAGNSYASKRLILLCVDFILIQ
jgi:hypothetical protein